MNKFIIVIAIFVGINIVHAQDAEEEHSLLDEVTATLPSDNPSLAKDTE